MSEKIVIKFEPHGDKKLITALNNLSKAQQKLESNLKKYGTTQSKISNGVTNLNTKILGLVSRYKNLNAASKGLGVSADFLRKALKGDANAASLVNARFKALNVQTKKLHAGFFSVTTSGRLLSNTFATLRSKMLLVSFGAMLIARSFGRLVDVYKVQELAEKKLSVALGKTSPALLRHASALQQVTTFGDEQIIGVQTQIAMFTKDEAQIKKVTKAVLDMAAAKGMDLATAGDLMAKSIGSSTNALSRYGVEIDNSLKGTARLNAIVEASSSIFGGQAAGETETLSGQLAQASNALGDLGEKLAEALAPIIEFFAEGIKNFAEGAITMLEVFNLIDDAADRAIQPIIDEQVQLQLLTTQLEKTTEGSEDFIKIRDKAMKQHPDYFKGIKKEKVTMQVLQGYIKDYNSHLRDMIQIKLAEVAVEDMINRNADVMLVYAERQVEAAKLETEARKLLVEELKLQDKYATIYMKSGEEAANTYLTTVMESLNETLSGIDFFSETAQTALQNAFDTGNISGFWEWVQDGNITLMDNAAAIVKSEEDVMKILKHMAEEMNLTQLELNRLFFELGISPFDPDNPDGIVGNAEARARTTQAFEDMKSGFAGILMEANKMSALKFSEFADVVVNSIKRIIAEFIALKLAQSALSFLGWIPGLGSFFDSDAIASLTKHEGGEVQGYATGGMIPMQGYATGGGVDNVPIMAQEGEYVIRRSAVESIGIENLNRMNQTGVAGAGVNITFAGNVMSDDFVENEAIPKIKDAIRRGADIGIS